MVRPVVDNLAKNDGVVVCEKVVGQLDREGGELLMAYVAAGPWGVQGGVWGRGSHQISLSWSAVEALSFQALRLNCWMLLHLMGVLPPLGMRKGSRDTAVMPVLSQMI